ncbi:MAG: SPOR domain-containing protein [Rhodospirillales bacterium]|nr:SPOR domain-containing protein [Rhodospirillales bacterium]
MSHSRRTYDEQSYEDEFEIPRATAGFRVQRRRPGIDRTTRNMIVVAAGIAVVMVLAVAVQAMLRPHGLPVVAAQSGPWRVKPVNPGGMKVVGANNAIFNGTLPASQDQVMPGPETPDLAALARDEHKAAQTPSGAGQTGAAMPARTPAGTEAQANQAATNQVPTNQASTGPIQAGTAQAAAEPPRATSGTNPATAVAAPPPSGAAATTLTAALPLPPTPTPAPAWTRIAVPKTAIAMAPMPGAAPAAGAAANGPAGGAEVQLAALPTEASARAEWQILSERMPGLLGHRAPLLTKALVHGNTWWRVRMGGFASFEAARAFCVQVRAQGGVCAPVRS